MNTDVEELIREALDQLAARAEVPAGLAAQWAGGSGEPPGK